MYLHFGQVHGHVIGLGLGLQVSRRAKNQSVSKGIKYKAPRAAKKNLKTLHNQGGDRVGGAHDSNEGDCCSQFLFCIDVVERLLGSPFNPKEEKEKEKGQNSSICHLH